MDDPHGEDLLAFIPLGAMKATGGTDMSSMANGDDLWCPRRSLSMIQYAHLRRALFIVLVEMYKPNESVLLCEDFL